MSLVSVVIDSREPDYVRGLTFGGVPTSVSQLDAGDLMGFCADGTLLVVERKEASDFLNSLRDGRLWAQLSRLRELSPWSYLALVGGLYPGPNGVCVVDGRTTGWNWSSVQGALLTAQELGVCVLHVAHGTDYEQAIIRLANRDRKALHVQPPREALLLSEAEVILGALPGVGPERAKAVLSYAGSPAWALQYLTDDDRQNDAVPGVGSGTKQRVRRALGLGDGAVLLVSTKDETKEQVA